MNIRHAILKTADHIEMNPREFNFNSVEVPHSPSCGTPGCAFGWIASFRGISRFHYALDVDPVEFYIRMDEMSGGARPARNGNYIVGKWRESASICSKALRLYADKYHPATAASIPDNVRAIFGMTHEQLRLETTATDDRRTV